MKRTSNIILALFCSMLCTLTLAAFAEAVHVPLTFTESELAWLAAHKGAPVKVRISRQYPPFESYDKNHYQGIAVDYLDKTFGALGIKYEPAADMTWAEALERVKRHDGVDVIAVITNTEERAAHLIFTRDYLDFPQVIFTRKEAEFISGVGSLSGRTVAVENSYIMHDWLLRDVPGIKFMIVQNTEDALKAVSSNKADAYVGNLAVGQFYLEKKGLVNLKVAAPTPYAEDKLAMAVRDDWPAMAHMLDKAIGSLSHEEQAAISNNWLTFRHEYGITLGDVLKWLGMIGLVAGIAIAWGMRLNRTVKGRTNELQRMLDEKEVLLAEVHHRVKNNMALISSFLNLQSFILKDDKVTRALKECRYRIKAMALVHESLYKSDNFKAVNVRDYVTRLVNDLLKGHGYADNAIRVTLDLDDVNINLNTLIPLGLVMNEIVTNSLKYAYKDHPEPALTISLKVEGQNKTILMISDNGPGMPEEDEIAKAPTLGTRIIGSLVTQIDGAMRIERTGGTKYIITFKLDR